MLPQLNPIAISGGFRRLSAYESAPFEELPFRDGRNHSKSLGVVQMALDMMHYIHGLDLFVPDFIQTKYLPFGILEGL